MKKRARPVLALGFALVAALLVFGGFGGGRTHEVQAQVLPSCDGQITFWSVCIVKVTDPSGTGAEFGFEYVVSHEGGGFAAEFDLEDLGTKVIALTEAAEKIVIREEDLPPGWELVDIQCTLEGQDPSITQNINIGQASVEIELESGPGFIYCVFYNELEDEPRTEPTPPGGRRPPSLGGGLGGLFSAPPPATPTVVAPAATSPVISPPRTGDAGLK